jgi:dipeptidyl aminopeptidase/acylaminoacyl peptidase
MLIDEGHEFLSSQSIKRQIGTDKEKLKRDSPRLHASDFDIPLLMLHGTLDAQVPFEQSEDMDRALKRAGKPHRFVVLPDGDHPLSAVKDRVILLREIQQFLGANLNPAPNP